ncbi:YveK family protein [Paenibacillus faecalis]|uniref:YveK family protein n=1 Tax=Paenibacillus faecalis TaxID=2079532 RepID=UPI00131A5932|nr:Wzz/FepE/Etk N-terminal domain-containing protein [Paenibacillus faecalis]
MEIKLLMSMLRKRIWLIAGFVLVCTIGAGYFSKFVMTPVYEASATLIVNKSNLDSSGNPALDINQINSNIMLINSYKVILSSASIMDKVVEKHPELGATSEDLRERLNIITTQNSQIITLKIQDQAYERAMLIVNAISKVFKEEIPQIMKVDNISILDTAKPQESPVPISPRVTLNIIIAFIASLMISAGIALLVEYLDDTVKTEADIEKYLELPTLGAIGKIRKKDMRPKLKSSSKQQAGEPYASVSQRFEADYER